jgi:D-glycero-alpha-D-manno-heptose-7-phosphate kinase
MDKYFSKKKIYSVTTMTPHRVSFMGGGTDYPKFYKKYEGSVINSTINKYLFVTVKAHGGVFSEKYRLMYSKTELCNKISEIKNNIARECLRLVPVDPPVSISTMSDLHPESGTGSSSCFAVGLLNALHTFRGERVSPNQLAQEACKIEIEKLKKTSGKQDQYAAAFGGINKFVFKKNDEIQIVPIKISANNISDLFSNLKMLWTGQKRDSSKIAKSYKLDQNNIENFIEFKKMVVEFQKELERGKLNYNNIGMMIKESWQTKKKFSNSIAPKVIENISKKLSLLGVEGHRLVGAGGGGFFLCLLNDKNLKKLRKNFVNSKIIGIDYEPQGSRVVSLIYN